ncbi:hypothetical protein NMT12_100043 [metagenome]
MTFILYEYSIIPKNVNMIMSYCEFIVRLSILNNSGNFNTSLLNLFKIMLTCELLDFQNYDQKRFNLNFNYISLFVIAIILVMSFQNVYAVNSIDWYYAGSSISDPAGADLQFVNQGDGHVDDSAVTVRVDATDESGFSPSVRDTINVTITSVDDPTGITYTLTETANTSQIFIGTSIVFVQGNYKFLITDTVNLTFTKTSGCANGVIDTIAGSGGSSTGFVVKSDTDSTGVGILLTETGPSTCTFKGQVKFTTGSSDESTGTLQVSAGDRLTIADNINGYYTNAHIIPVAVGKGAIKAIFDSPDVASSAEVTATYNGLSKGLDIDDDGSGGGGTGGLARPGLVLNVVASLLSVDSSNGGSKPTSPPTLGLDVFNKRIVEDGFSFNGNSVDVEKYYTSYPLITTTIGQNNTIKLKIFEDAGLDNIAHVGVSYGLGKGKTFNEGRATIEYDRTFDDIEYVTVFDPKNVLGIVNVTTTTTNCDIYNNTRCLEISFFHIFRESLDYNMVATNIWDFDRNGWQNYFNHGIQITGKSMNPPEQYSGIHHGNIYHLTKTDKNKAIDDNGYYWTFDKVWNRDYIPPVIDDKEILNPEKISAIKKLGFEYSDAHDIFGFSRMNHGFIDGKNQQQIKAQLIMNNLCPKCQKSFDNIDDTFSYDFPERYSKLHKNKILIDFEAKRAQEFLKQYFDQIYVGKKYS